MHHRSRFVRRGLLPAAVTIAVGIGSLVAPAVAGYAWTNCSSNCFVVTPVNALSAVAAGTGTNYAFQVTDDDPGQTLQSLTFAAPADFTITSAADPSGTSVSALPASSVTLELPSNTGSPFTVDLTVLAPCVGLDQTSWAVSGADTNGDTNVVRWSSSPPSVSVTGQCGLAFTGQPAQTAVNSSITTGFNSTGSPLTVQLLDANGNPLNVADFSADQTQVTVSIGINPGGGTLTGTSTVDSSNGVASFAGLQINAPGAGYALAASAPGFTPATSDFFTITGQIQACGSGSCTASQSTSTTAASLAASSPGNFVALGLGGVTLSCAHYNAVSDVAAFGVFNSAGSAVPNSSAIVTLTIAKSLAKSAHRRLWQWQVCYGSPVPFPAVPGTGGSTVIGGTTYYTGLLLSCFIDRHHRGHGQQQPCLLVRQRTRAGAVQLTFVALGDPLGRE